MHRSSRLSLCILALALGLIPSALYSQSISYQNPDEFFACDEAVFSITVQNTGGSAMTNGTVTVNFSTTNGTACGIQYVVGSVSAPVSQGNISNLSAPQFSLPTLAAGASQSFTIQAKATCQTAACIDNAEVFVNNISLTWSGGSTSTSTNPYVLDRALLLFTNVNSTVMSGSRDEVLQRKLTIRNTRPGSLSEFILRDVYQPGLSITSAQGTVLPSPFGSLALRLGAADFSTIGDGDDFFEFNESIVVTEDITVLSCGVDQASAVSNLTASWGCGGDTCQQESVTAVVVFEQYAKKPQLTFEPTVRVPHCFCGPEGIEQGLKITNAGDGLALNIRLDFLIPSQNPRVAADSSSISMDSSGTAHPFVLATNDDLVFPFNCAAPSGLVREFSVSNFSLAPGESVTIFWDNYFCTNECSQPATRWMYKYSYSKECPPNIFVQNSQYTTVNAAEDFLQTTAELETIDIVHDGETHTGVFLVDYDSLNTSDDILSVQMQLPCGMEWLPSNPLLLNDQTPLDVDVALTDSFTVVTATYQLPLALDTGRIEFDFTFHCDEVCINKLPCEYDLQTTCTNSCFLNLPPVFQVNITTTLVQCGNDPLGCNIQSCTEMNFPYDCDYDSTCVDAPPGYLRYDFEALRKNYGLPDSNNDRYPDAFSGLPDMNLVERRRLMPGDTIQATIRGEVVIDKPGATLPYGYLELFFIREANLAFETQDSLMRPSGIVPAGVVLKVLDSSTNTWYECDNPPFTTSAKITYKYDLEALKGLCLPANFFFDDGDSIVFIGNYRINHNPKRELGINEPDPLRGNFRLSPKLVLFDSMYQEYSIINCNCEELQMQLTYYEFVMVPNTVGLPPCEPSNFGQPVNFRIDLHQGNFFPFEHRNLLKVEDFRLLVPPSIQICSTRINSLRWQSSAAFVTQETSIPPLVNGEYFNDLSQYQAPLVDEGFAGNLDFIYKNVCDNKFSLPVTYSLNLDWAPGLPEPDDPEEFSLVNNSLRPLIANLSIEAPLYNLVSFSNRMQFDFLFKNTPTFAGSLSSGPAPNTWLYVTSPTGLVNDFQLVDLTTGQPVPLVNGLFQLGSLPVNPDGFPYRLVGTNNSCERERLFIHYGWNCDQLQSTVQTPCYEQILPLFIESPPGEIDMIVNSPSGCSQLCDTIPYHSIEVFNAQFGSVYNLRVKALVTPGMNILAGSTVVEYPTGSGTLYPIGDPTVVSTGVVEWNLSMLFDSIAAGLPGVGQAPRNSLTLRFLGESTCDFVADAYTLFIAAAEQNCGIPSNSIAKPGDPVCIDGVTGPYTTNISVTPTPGFGCNDGTSFEVSLNSSAVLPPGACLIATLPPGITFVPGSCQNQCASNFNCTPTINGSQVTWQLPAGTLPNQLVCFKFNTQGWAGLGCENGVVLFRSAAETQALCALTGDTCSTKVSTGSLILPFDPQRPAYELGNFTITATASGNNNLVNASVQLTNAGATSLPPTLVQFFADTDGDGDGDQLLSSQLLNSPIANGQTVTVTGSFSVPSAISLCQLLAVVDASQQCACAGDVEVVSTPIVFNTGLSWTVCSNTNQIIGIPDMAGFDYQWSPADCIASPQAAMTVFNCENNGFAPETTEFMVTESNGICEITHKLSVTVQPVPGIAYADSPICPGESANLAATEGQTYNWQGPGIAQPNQQIVTVMPTTTSQYNVTVTDAFGCSGNETTTVVVAPQPVLEAGPNETFCPGELPQLSASFDPDWDYLWSPQTVSGLPALNNPTIANPVVLTGQTTTFSLSILDENGCSAMDALTVSFADSLVLTMPPDITICTGSSTTLVVQSNLPATFTWSPNDGDCLNATPCASYTVSPSATTTYTVTGVSNDGCAVMGSVTVTVSNDLIVTNGPPLEICQGQTVVINGQTVSEPGIYCDTFTVVGGCDSVYCVVLSVNAGIDTTFLDTMVCLGASVEFEGQTYSEEGEYCVMFPGTNGCDSVRCLLLTVEDLGIKTTLDSTICQGDSVFFEGQFYTEEGEHCVTYSTPDGCDSLSCLNLVINELPLVEIIGNDTISEGDTLVLELDPPGPFETILWFANDSLLADCTGELTCAVSPTDSVTYTVQVTDAGTGCAGTDSLAVTVVPDCNPEEVEVPNAFSPNGDSNNDSFDIVGPGAEATLNMRIWNKWGQKVYDGTGPWDGRHDGKPAPSDVYIYLVKVGCAVPVEDMEKEFKGDVTLLR